MEACVECGREHDRSSSCMTPMVSDPTQKADMMRAAEALLPALRLVYGWKMPRSAFTRLVTADMGASDLRLLASPDGFVMGMPLAALRGDKATAGVRIPEEARKAALISAAQALGLSDITVGEPQLWLVDDRKGKP